LQPTRLFASLDKLFVKIFLWFWITTCGVIIAVVGTSYLNGMRVVEQPNILANFVPILAEKVVRAYETGGADAFEQFCRTNFPDQTTRVLYLLDGAYHDVLSRPITPNGLLVAHAARSGKLVMLRSQFAAYRTTSTSGNPYVVLLITEPLDSIRETTSRREVLLLPMLLCLVTVLCVWLAHHITSPIYAIQAAARRVSLGDLRARAPEGVLRRHDELASLGGDFNTMVERIEVLLRSHKNLLSAVSHELRSPLTRLNMSLTMLNKSIVDEKGRELVERMNRDIAAIDRLMGQLLTLSRLEAGHVEAHREDVDLSQLVGQVGADGAFEAKASGKLVSVKAQEGVILPSSDPYALRSACENVVRNAIRFTAPGTTVEIELAVDGGAQGPCALIAVRDSGSGVPEDLLETIFQPFFQAPTNTDSIGNGLGLAIAAEAIRLHRGTIAARNRPGTGLEVVVQLPLDRASTDRKTPEDHPSIASDVAAS
jgi:two-component system sensor histidine kinase CpxA